MTFILMSLDPGHGTNSVAFQAKEKIYCPLIKEDLFVFGYP